MSDRENSNPERLFRVPPDTVTNSCLIYIARINELRDFIAFFFGIIKSSSALAAALSNESATQFKEEAEKYVLGKYNYSRHRQFINEITLSRAVETFDLYVLHILSQIFDAKPEILKSEGTVDIAAVIDLKNFEDIVSYIAEKKLHELSFKPLHELRKYISGRTGLDLFGSDQAYETVLLASEVRNLIAHNDCRLNEIFERRVPASVRSGIKTSEMGKVIITDEWVREACYTMDGLVFDFDRAAAEKFSLKTTVRKMSFLFRG